MDFPGHIMVSSPRMGAIGPFSTGQVLGDYARCGRLIGATAVWGAANGAYYQPFTIDEHQTITQLAWFNGTAVSGNCDIGVYDWAGTRLVSIGSTAQSGTSTVQAVNIADTALSPGDYYLGMSMDNVTGQVFRLSIHHSLCIAAGMKVQATGAFPLPATATFSDPTVSFNPVVQAFTFASTI